MSEEETQAYRDVFALFVSIPIRSLSMPKPADIDGFLQDKDGSGKPIPNPGSQGSVFSPAF